MRRVYTLIIVTLAIGATVLVYYERQQRLQLEKVTAYLAASTREIIETRLQRVKNEIQTAQACAQISQAATLVSSAAHLHELELVLDSARIMIGEMAGLAKDRDRAAVSFSSYKTWLASKGRVFSNSPTGVMDLLINRELNLNNELLPASISISGANAVQLSAIVLEDALISVLSREVEQEMQNFGGCEHLRL